MFDNLNHYLNSAPKQQLTLRDAKCLDIAHDHALKSVLRYRVGAVIYGSKFVYGYGFNQAKTHPVYNKWHKLSTHTHAEARALLRAVRAAADDHVPWHYLSIAVVRLDKHERRGVSYPCKHCFAMLRDAGINRFVCNDTTGSAVAIDLTEDL